MRQGVDKETVRKHHPKVLIEINDTCLFWQGYEDGTCLFDTVALLTVADKIHFLLDYKLSSLNKPCVLFQDVYRGNVKFRHC